jgi:hypothetical protein
MSNDKETNLFGALGDSITEALKGFIEKITPKEKRYAPFLQFSDTITLPANGFGVMSLRGPTRGRFSYVRKLRVSGVTPTSVSSTIEQSLSGGSVPVILTIAGGGTLLSISFVYNTSAVVANRTIVVSVLDATNKILYQAISPFTQTASLSTEYSLAPGLTSSASGAPVSVTMPLPAGLVIPPGGKVSVNAQGVDPGDTVSNGAVLLTGAVRADVFIGPDDLRSTATLAQCPIITWRDQFTTIPDVKSYGVGELRVGSQELVSIAISNGAIAQTFVVSGEAYEWPDVDENVEWIM